MPPSVSLAYAALSLEIEQILRQCHTRVVGRWHLKHESLFIICGKHSRVTHKLHYTYFTKYWSHNDKVTWYTSHDGARECIRT
jgi:hypothetical protein